MKTREIVLNRDSICMGDDCISHKKIFTIDDHMTMINLFEYLIKYVPNMYNAIWVIQSGKNICGYLITDDNGQVSIELVGENCLIMNTQMKDIMCRHYSSSSFTWIDGETGESVHKYDESLSLLEKVKKAIGEYL